MVQWAGQDDVMGQDERLAEADVVSFTLRSRPVMREAEVDFSEDPQWDEFQEAIAAYRRELDAELADELEQVAAIK